MAYAADQIEMITRIVEEAGELLPPQAPLGYFSHHNPLHALEELPFQRAVEHASAMLGTEALQTEEAFAAHLASGRILPRDLAAVLEHHGDRAGAVPGRHLPVGDQGPRGAGEEMLDGDAEVVPGGPTWNEFRLARLGLFIDVPRGAGALWALADGGELHRVHPLVTEARREELTRQGRRRFATTERRTRRSRAARLQAPRARLLAQLWEDLRRHAPPPAPRPVPLRRRDQVLEQFGVDTDEAVHPVLIRLCAAFLDQGVAAWEMPHREKGLLAAFRHLFGTLGAPREACWAGLGGQLRQQLRMNWSAERTVAWALWALQVPVHAWADTVRATLVSLRGWAGMVHQFECRPDRAPSRPAPARLMDYLAVQLTLEVVVSHNVLARLIGPDARPEDLGPLGAPAAPGTAQGVLATGTTVQDDLTQGEQELRGGDLELAYEAFVLAQVMDVETEVLGHPRWARAWLRAVAEFDAGRRRWLLHLAYERRYRTQVLDALSAHDRRFPGTVPPPDFQAVFCMDEREESLRRHLEESHPQVRTYGASGYFGVAMAYQGLDDVRPRALCPVTMTPRSLVVERAVNDGELVAYQRARRRKAQLQHTISAARGRPARAAAYSAIAGLAELVPLAARAVAPRAAGEGVRMLGRREPARPLTRLVIEAAQDHTPFTGPAGDGAQAGEAGELVPGVGAGPLRLGFTVEEMAEIVDTLLTTIGMSGPLGPVVFVIGHGSSSVNNPHAAAYDCGATGGGQSGPNARAFAAMANHPRVRAALAHRGRLIGPDTWFVGGHHDTCDSSLAYYDTDLVPAHLRPALTAATDALLTAVQLDAHERCRRFESVGPDVAAGTAHAHVRGRSEDIGQSRPEYGHSTNATCVIGRRSRTRGLYLDRRSFLVSYDPTADPDGSVLTRLLLSAAPVGAGINLEYYFSRIDPIGYGAGSKLPHNITGLVGVMDGHGSDLRTGMPWQSVEIHEPMRLLVIAEAEPERLARVVRENPPLRGLVEGGWIQLAAWDPSGPETYLYRDGAFEQHQPENLRFPVVARSEHYYAGQRDHLPPAHVLAAFGESPDVVIDRPGTVAAAGAGAVQPTRDAIELPEQTSGPLPVRRDGQ
ncbi:DUF2309 domain-containing protein [Frankia sp. Mgl5]|uniref:DUF2309 domain-containing protein n=1 Tax=Frankia sp. Mgl5 TaxID=2933793 RepID=UPI002010C39B|nr:DUF2309 domain-containing protein [Frankia sp. Mgl5]MCK9930457.1 DUF2309 domain-containing protein [Frankia sp. Mgl5]